MRRAEQGSAPPAGSAAQARRQARAAHARGLRAGNAGRPATGARQLRAGLRQLGWADDDGQAGPGGCCLARSTRSRPGC